MERRVRTSAKAMVIRDGRLLVIKVADADGSYYILPGGGQRAGELLKTAAEREVAKETGIAVRANDIAFVIEGAEGEAHHRVDIVFQCDVIGEADTAFQPDRGQTGIAWLEVASLNRQPLYPSKLRRAVMNRFSEKKSCVYLGNENAGDPEVTE